MGVENGIRRETVPRNSIAPPSGRQSPSNIGRKKCFVRTNNKSQWVSRLARFFFSAGWAAWLQLFVGHRQRDGEAVRTTRPTVSRSEKVALLSSEKSPGGWRDLHFIFGPLADSRIDRSSHHRQRCLNAFLR